MHHRRILITGDSRVMTGCVAKGRSPADGMNADLKKVVPDFLGGDLSSATFWTESARCTADEPSRNRKIRKAALPTAWKCEVCF